MNLNHRFIDEHQLPPPSRHTVKIYLRTSRSLTNRIRENKRKESFHTQLYLGSSQTQRLSDLFGYMLLVCFTHSLLKLNFGEYQIRNNNIIGYEKDNPKFVSLTFVLSPFDFHFFIRPFLFCYIITLICIVYGVHLLYSNLSR